MMQFDRMTLGRKARELGFVRDTFEKLCICYRQEKMTFLLPLFVLY